MARRFLALLFIVLTVLGAPTYVLAAGLTTFTSEQEAQQHCPRDVVVWLNLPTGVYHFRGQRWYGATKHGAYVCKQEADQSGDRATRNGQ